MRNDVFENTEKCSQVGKNEKIVLVKLTKSARQFFDQNLYEKVCGGVQGDIVSLVARSSDVPIVVGSKLALHETRSSLSSEDVYVAANQL